MVKYNYSFILILFLGLLTFNGCATLMSKEEQLGRVYSGVQFEPELMKCSFFLTAAFPPFVIFAVPFHIVDFGLSFVVDTLLIPADLVAIASGEHPPPLRKFCDVKF